MGLLRRRIPVAESNHRGLPTPNVPTCVLCITDMLRRARLGRGPNAMCVSLSSASAGMFVLASASAGQASGGVCVINNTTKLSCTGRTQVGCPATASQTRVGQRAVAACEKATTPPGVYRRSKLMPLSPSSRVRARPSWPSEVQGPPAAVSSRSLDGMGSAAGVTTTPCTWCSFTAAPPIG